MARIDKGALTKMVKPQSNFSKIVFGEYRPDWTDAQFAEAEMLVSGIEYATLMTAGDPVSLEARITSALNNILTIPFKFR